MVRLARLACIEEREYRVTREPHDGAAELDGRGKALLDNPAIEGGAAYIESCSKLGGGQ